MAVTLFDFYSFSFTNSFSIFPIMYMIYPPSPCPSPTFLLLVLLLPIILINITNIMIFLLSFDRLCPAVQSNKSCQYLLIFLLSLTIWWWDEQPLSSSAVQQVVQQNGLWQIIHLSSFDIFIFHNSVIIFISVMWCVHLYVHCTVTKPDNSSMNCHRLFLKREYVGSPWVLCGIVNELENDLDIIGKDIKQSSYASEPWLCELRAWQDCWWKIQGSCKAIEASKGAAARHQACQGQLWPRKIFGPNWAAKSWQQNDPNRKVQQGNAVRWQFWPQF